MKNATACTKHLTALLKKLPAAEPPEFQDQDDPISVLVQSFLICETTGAKATLAYRRLRESIVDYNDLRVTMPEEMAAYLGARYPQAIERCQRLRTVLRNVYLREHNVGLERVAESGKRDARKYLESLEGMWPYVASRVMLLSFGVHAIPVDEQMLGALQAAKAVDESADVSTASTWLSRQIKSGDGVATYHRLQAWAETAGTKPSRKKSKTTAKTASKTTKKVAPEPAKSPAKTATKTSKTTKTTTKSATKTTTKKKSARSRSGS